jgi:nucleoside-diphosphate-sugar epimerase
LVTGAAGNVGTELVKQLSTAGAIFRAGVHSNKSADKIGKISSRAQLIEIDSYRTFCSCRYIIKENMYL